MGTVYALLGRVQLAWFVIRQRASLVLSVALTIGGLVALQRQGVSSLSVLTLGLAAVEMAIVLADVRDVARESGSRAVMRSDLDQWRLLPPPTSGHVAEMLGRTVWWSSAEVDALLRTRQVPVVVRTEPYRIPDEVRRVAPALLADTVRSRAITFNGRKVRQASDLTPSGEPVVVQPTDYFSSLATNNALDLTVSGTGFDGAALATSNGWLRDLGDLQLSNHIGVSTLAITSDDKLVLVSQTSKSVESPNRVVASGSGSLDWADVRRAQPTTLQQLVRAGAERELREECGVGRSIAVESLVLGFARDVRRAGKPEYFLLSRVDARYASLRHQRRERSFVATHEDLRVVRDVSALVTDLQRLVQSRSAAMGDGLRYHLQLLVRLLDAADPSVCGFISRPVGRSDPS